jgi:oxygen-independent coproporphyrinogen-3 oxidase
MSMDLMFGLPEQSMAEWKESLEWALEMKPEHLSFYGLTIEPGTRFHHLHEQGMLPLPEEGLQAEMYEFGIARLASAGLKQYEISNFARPGRESVHNRLYWKNRETLGLGAGAWSYVSGERFSRLKNPRAYIEAVESGAKLVAESERLEPAKARGEALYLGLRLREGVDLAAWERDYQSDFLASYGKEAKNMVDLGVLEWDEKRLKISEKGLSVANRVFEAFL